MKWIACDINKSSIQTTSNRLQSIIKSQNKIIEKENSKLALEEKEVFDETLDIEQKAELFYEQFRKLSVELKAHDDILKDKKYLVTVNKSDLYSEELILKIAERFAKEGIVLHFFSGATQIGLADIKEELKKLVR